MDRLSNAAISYCRYVRIAIWLDPLIVYYYYDLINIVTSTAVLSVFALILVTAACWRFRKQRPYCLVGWLWFLGTLAPVIGIVQVVASPWPSLHLSSLHRLIIAMVWLVGDAVVKLPKIKLAAQLLAVAVIIACATKTDAQVKCGKTGDQPFRPRT